ncbi:MAG: CDP-diacylglycerol/serine O-phosphatidyltransferase [Firmicutes bacterium]|nr:CDP-diacylglycerol/serine O-phosphatidyltransferase [Bacillota bacterium]
MKTFIPNLITSLNLVFGFLSIIATIHESYILAAVLVVIAMLADGMDGRVARYFKVSSEFGKELDSLCDLVSFGVAPALLAYSYLLKDMGYAGAAVGAAFAVCGALRLARFNVNVGIVKGYFMGLPIPAAGCVVATFVMLGIKPPAWMFLVFVAIFAYLMVSTIKYPDFKGKGEKIRLIPAIVSLIMAGGILWFSVQAIIFVIFFAYAVFGILNTAFGLFDA